MKAGTKVEVNSTVEKAAEYVAARLTYLHQSFCAKYSGRKPKKCDCWVEELLSDIRSLADSPDTGTCAHTQCGNDRMENSHWCERCKIFMKTPLTELTGKCPCVEDTTMRGNGSAADNDSSLPAAGVRDRNPGRSE